MSGTVLILGATGRFGRHATEAFWNAGWQVRTFDRRTDDLMQAARGVNVIVNAWNPPYTAWKRDVPKLTRQVIDAARISDATVIIPGNIYGYGKGAPPIFSADTPQQATNPLALIRIEMEAAYRDAGVKTIVLRAGDYIDTEASGNWFDMIITAKLAKGIVVAPGAMDVTHAWAYLPDVARAAVDLAERREALAHFDEVLYPGFTLSLRDVTDLLAAVTGRELTLKPMNWLPLWLAQPVWPLAAKILEMRYLWSMPHQLDGTKFNKVLANFQATEPSVAIAQAIRHLDVHPDKSMTRSSLDIITQ
ncbi:epimerase [Rhodobacteraceae bacterium]|nr:epimerase [Paracoccaceae bacterium]